MRKFRGGVALAGAGLVMHFMVSATGAPPVPPVPQTGDAARITGLISKMTLPEKLMLIRGAQEPAATSKGEAGYLAGIPRLHIPPIRLSDGPPGVLVSKPSTATVATMALAATFSRKDAEDNGAIIADEAKRLDVNLVLEPFINLDRDLTFSRGYNTYGEDPFLTGQIGAAFIHGVQDQGVMAQAKHFAAYSSNSKNIWVDDQSLHEVYLAPFADAISAGVSSIMCSYNQINGAYACGNRRMLTDVLRGEMHFQGFVTSDWGAVHDYDYLAHGLDMEMPGMLPKDSPMNGFLRSYFDLTPAPHVFPDYPPVDMKFLFPGTIPEEPEDKDAFAGGSGNTKAPAYRNLWDGLLYGTTTTAEIDRAASRVLGQLDRFGYLDARHAVYWKARSGLDLNAVNLRTAEDGAVLLKNADNILPLKPEKTDTIAMIGPGAKQLVAIGKAGERGMGFPARQISPYLALKSVLPYTDISLAMANDMNGRLVPGAVLSSDGKPGLARVVDDKPEMHDAVINFTKASGHPLPAGRKFVWSGNLKIEKAGTYRLYVQTIGGRGSLFIDGKKVSGASGGAGGMHGDTLQPNQDNLLPTPDGLDNVRVAVSLKAGAHTIRIEENPDRSEQPVQVRFCWVTPEQKQLDFVRAVAAAKKAKTAVVFVWARGAPVFALPGDQDKLIEAVAAVNPNTVVVLNTSQPVAMPWRDKVKGILQMWWPGDEGGQATANVLSGKVNPGGRLPVTWGKQLSDYAANAPGHPERSGKGLKGKTIYSEGVDIGYRLYDKLGIEPLYPFGYGLSYTRFAYSGLTVKQAVSGGFDVTFTVKNIGWQDGDAVPQIYLSAPGLTPAGVQFAPKTLAGFRRVSLKAGAAQRVIIHLGPRRMQYWSTSDQSWKTLTYGRMVMLGASSRDIRLSTALQ